MTAIVRKYLSCSILKHTSPLVGSSRSRCRTPISFSFSLHFFSTSKETQLGTRPTVSDIFMHKHSFPPDLASRVASKLSRLTNPEKVDSVLSFLKESGFSNTQLVKIVKYWPQFLLASLDGCMKPKIKVLLEAGLSSDDIAKIISSNPKIVHASLDNNIIPKLSVLKGLLGSTDEVVRIVSLSPRLLTVNLENNLLPNVEFLRSCGIPMERIHMILIGYPRSFLLKPERIRKSVEKAKEMGLKASSKSFIYAIPTIASMSNEAWELKLQAFRNVGFSDSDILTMFGKAPRAFAVSAEKLNKVVELLLGTRKYNISNIASYPVSLWCSVEKRYIPRLKILGILESRNLIEKWPILRTICGYTDRRFSNTFIRPHLDQVSDVLQHKEVRGKRDDSLSI